MSPKTQTLVSIFALRLPRPKVQRLGFLVICLKEGLWLTQV